MTSLLFELSRNQDVQKKVREEVKKVLAKHEGKFTYEALSEMNYLESCIYGEKMTPLSKIITLYTHIY